ALDVPVDDVAHEAQARALQPCAADADQHAQDNADRGELERRQESADEARAIERIVEDREIDSGRIAEPPEPVPETLHRPSPSAGEAIARGAPAVARPRARCGRPLFILFVHFLRKLRRLDAVFLLELLDEAR